MSTSTVPKYQLQWDLTHRVSPFLDTHLVFPLLEFLEKQTDIYEQEDLLRSKLDLLGKTNMVDFAVTIHKTLNKTEDVPAEMSERRAAVVAELEALQKKCAPLLAVLEDNDLISELKHGKVFTLAHLEQHHNVPREAYDELRVMAKFQFDCGNYSAAASYLYYYRALAPANVDAKEMYYTTWGKFAAEVLQASWSAALEDMNRLREFIDTSKAFTPLEQLEQRVWLIHWSLFVFFNQEDGRNGIVDMFMNDRYLNAIQTACPHILRYLTTAVITNKRRRKVLKDLVKAIEIETYQYRDPITELLQCLYVDFDFDAAQQKLRECELVLQNDFFLVSCREEFMENARVFIFETYCRVHQRIDISMLAEKLDMDTESAETWIVNLIRNARLDAKIDSANNQVVMGSNQPSIYQQVIDKTKSLSYRTYVLSNNLERRSTN